jgi:GTP:adenosylcobinamide-phosphate guanylyltransferase
MRALATRTEPIELAFESIHWSTTRHQCVFLLVKPTLELIELHRSAHEAVTGSTAAYQPHLSLIYSDKDLTERRDVAQSIDMAALPSSIICQTMKLVDTTGLESEWETVAAVSLSNQCAADAFRIIVATAACMQALIPAAGRGTRLGERTETRPKGLVDIAGRPLLAHVFETAADAGTDELVVVIGYEKPQIVDHFGDSFAGVPITYVHQREQLGLGHAVLQAESHVDGPFLLLNGDNVFAGSVAPAVAAADQRMSTVCLPLRRCQKRRRRRQASLNSTTVV